MAAAAGGTGAAAAAWRRVWQSWLVRAPRRAWGAVVGGRARRHAHRVRRLGMPLGRAEQLVQKVQVGRAGGGGGAAALRVQHDRVARPVGPGRLAVARRVDASVAALALEVGRHVEDQRACPSRGCGVRVLKRAGEACGPRMGGRRRRRKAAAERGGRDDGRGAPPKRAPSRTRGAPSWRSNFMSPAPASARHRAGHALEPHLAHGLGLEQRRRGQPQHLQRKSRLPHPFALVAHRERQLDALARRRLGLQLVAARGQLLGSPGKGRRPLALCA